MAPVVRTWDGGDGVQRLGRGLAGFVGFTLLVCVGVTWLSLLSPEPLSPPGQFLVVSIGITLTGLAARAASGHFSWPEHLTLVCVLVLAPVVPDPTGSANHVLVGLLSTIALLSIPVVWRPRTALPAAGLLAVALLLSDALVGDSGPDSIDTLVIISGAFGCAVVFLEFLFVVFRQADETASRRSEAEAHSTSLESAARASQRARNAIHSGVLDTLSLVHTDASVEEMRRAASDALAELDEVARGPSLAVHAERSRSGVPLATLTAIMRARFPWIVVVVETTPSAAELSVPQPLFDVLVDAVDAALRNIRMHAGVDLAQIVLDVTDEGGCIVISDDGVGLPPNMQPGFGTSSVMIGSLERFGGTVSLQPNPGGGTAVRISWPIGARNAPNPRSRLHTAHTLVLADQVGQGWIKRGAAPVLVAQSVLAIRWSLKSDHTIYLLALAVACVVLLTATAAVLDRRPVDYRTLGVVLFACLLVQVIGTMITGLDAFADYSSWYIGFASFPVFLLAFVLPRTEAIVVSLAFSATTVAIVLVSSGALEFPAAYVGVTFCSYSLLAAILMAMLLTRVHRETEIDRRRLAALAARFTESQVARDTAIQHLSGVSESAVPWLRGVAEGTIEPRTEAGAREVATLQKAMLDELYVPGAMDAALKNRISRFRDRGGSVRVRSIDPDSGTVQLGLRLLDRALDVAGQDAEMTLTLNDPDVESRLQIKPAPSTSVDGLLACLEGVPHRMSSGPVGLRLHFRPIPRTGHGHGLPIEDREEI